MIFRRFGTYPLRTDFLNKTKMVFSRNLNGKAFTLLQLKTATAIFVMAVLFVLVTPHALALDTGLQYGTATGLGTQDIRVSVMKIIRIALGLVGIIAILIVLYAGFVWMTSGGNPEKIDTAKRTLRNAVIGLLIIFSAFAIVSYIIGVLEGALIGGEPGSGGQPGACENCGHLGSGIIERVYPIPFARDVARNTNIMVTFKVTMNPDTVIQGCSAVPCSGNVVSDNVRIFPYDQNEGARLADDEVIATTVDGKTFVFNPVDYLGDGIRNSWYSVKLTNGIRKDNGESAFPGVSNYFLWRFEIGTFLDLDPAEVDNLFPQPDDQGDAYTRVDASQASGAIVISALPQINVTPQTSNLIGTPGAPEATITGTYNCSVDALICVTNTGGNFSINPKATGAANCSAPNISVSGLNTQAPASGGAVNLGCGLTLSLVSASASGNQWSFNATAARTADTLRVDSRTYTFVASSPSGSQIARAANITAQASAIAAKIVSDNLAVGAQSTNATINLAARIAGSAGNSIVIQSSGAWAQVTAMSGGEDASFKPTTRDVPDKPRNAVIAIDFNEAIDPTKINPDTVTIEYDSDPGTGETWTRVAGVYLVSNQYKTVEFLSENACVDGNGQPIVNACGEAIYCLPVNDPTPYEATRYRVSIKAGSLKLCSSAADCTDPNFNVCVQTPGGGGSVCQGTFTEGGVWYPEANAIDPAGIIDAANNTFNGNRNAFTLAGQVTGRADGPQSQSGQTIYDANNPQDATGDDFQWYFYINKNIKLSPPVITEISPVIADTNASIIDPAQGTFTDVMMSASLKPGSNYRDGQCGCSQDNECNQDAGERCDIARGKCVSDQNQNYCEQNSECDTNLCINKKYVSLVDRSTSPVGWWITKDNLDTISPLDSFADQSRAMLNHTRFNEVTSYGAEVGSGVKDIYQNCFLPSEGPGFTQPTCNVSAAQPYCCNGAALSKAAWEGSDCFTGY